MRFVAFVDFCHFVRWFVCVVLFTMQVPPELIELAATQWARIVCRSVELSRFKQFVQLKMLKMRDFNGVELFLVLV